MGVFILKNNREQMIQGIPLNRSYTRAESDAKYGTGGITINTTTITGGTNTRVLFNDAGKVGESSLFTFTKATGTLVTTIVNLPTAGSYQIGGQKIVQFNTSTSAVNLGYNNTASGTQVVCVGQNNSAAGDYRTVFGRTNTVGANDDVAMGNDNNVLGAGAFQGSSAFGYQNTIGNFDDFFPIAVGNSIAIGKGNHIDAGADGSLIVGVSNYTQGGNSAIFGNNNTVYDFNAVLIGNNLTSGGAYRMDIGIGSAGFSTDYLASNVYAGDFNAAIHGNYMIIDGSGTTFNNFVSAPNFSSGGDVSANTFTGGSFSGDGSAITSLSAGNISSGTVAVARGGTNIGSYAVGDIIYASGSTTLSKLADVATGNALISGGVTTAPSWGKIGLTTHISGTLGAANGGTGVANNAASTIAISGNFATTFTVSAATSVTLPTSGTLATTAHLPPTMKVFTSSTAVLNLNSVINSLGYVNVFNGSANDASQATWTLPPVASMAGKVLAFLPQYDSTPNAGGTPNFILKANASELITGLGAPSNSHAFGVGRNIQLYCDGTKWIVMFIYYPTFTT